MGADGPGLDALELGAFGENFTVEGLSDEEVCIGDRFRIGGAAFEVTQPRVTCFRVGMRIGQPQLPSLLVGHHRPGFYLRVLTEGYVEAGDDIARISRGRHQMSASLVYYTVAGDPLPSGSARRSTPAWSAWKHHHHINHQARPAAARTSPSPAPG